MRVFVAGASGAIGRQLVPRLVEAGHEVTGLDTGYYRDGWLYSPPQQPYVSPGLINKDLRHITSADLEGFDAIVHFAFVRSIRLQPDCGCGSLYTSGLSRTLRTLYRATHLYDDADCCGPDR